MDRDFWLATRKFWKTIGHLRKKKQNLAQAVFSHEGALLNQTGISSEEEAEFEDSGEVSVMSLAEVTEVVKKLLIGKAPGVDEILTEMLKAVIESNSSGGLWGRPMLE